MPTPVLDKAENARYYAFWSENRRSKRKSMGTSDRDVAEAVFAQWLLLGGHKGEVTVEAQQSLTVGDLWPIYFEKHVCKENVNSADAENGWKNLEPYFGGKLLRDIDQDAADDYLDRRQRGAKKGGIGRPAASSTVRRELAVLRACLNWCAHPKRKPRLIEKADVPMYDLPDDSDPRERWLTTEEIKRLMAAAVTLRRDDRMGRGERFLWLALETAARERAIAELTWDRVDFEIGVIHFAVPGRKQTKKRRVSVPISDALRPVLERMHDERINDFVLDNSAKVWATVQIIVERAGLAEGPVMKRKNGAKPKSTGISPHTFRHTAATHMARRGVPLYDIAGILGNTVAMVEKVYAKHSPDRLRAAVNSITSGVLEPAE